MTKPLPTPSRIVEDDGTVHVGWFEEPFEEANLQDSPILRHIPGFPNRVRKLLQRGFRKIRLKTTCCIFDSTDRANLKHHFPPQFRLPARPYDRALLGAEPRHPFQGVLGTGTHNQFVRVLLP